MPPSTPSQHRTPTSLQPHSAIPSTLAPVALLLALATLSRAQEPAHPALDPPTVTQVRAGFPIDDNRPGASRPGSSNDVLRRRTRIGFWTPVSIDVQAGSSPFQGTLELACPDDDDIPFVIRIPLNLTPGNSQRISTSVRPGTLEVTLETRLIDSSGKPIGRAQPWKLETPLDWTTILVLGAGPVHGLGDLASLLKFQSSTSTPLATGRLDELPDSWFALDAVETIALATSDPATLHMLQGTKTSVLRQWVEQGGHLIISLGENWPDAAKTLGDLLPARPTEILTLSELSDLGAIESFAGNVSRPIRPPLRVVKLEDVDQRGATTLAAISSTPLVVRAPFGFGRITLTGVDVARPPMQDWPDRRLLWDKLVDIRGRSSDAGVIAGAARGALIQQANPDLAARIHQSLGAFPGVRMIPFGWVAFLIFLYLVLIGPVDYLFLRNVLKRMQLTWLTFPLIVLATSALAFGVAQSFKGNQLRINKTDLLDVDQTRGTLRGASWLTLFSPANQDYSIAVQPHPANLNTSSDTPALISNTMSWFGPPDTGFSGVGRVALGNRRASYDPAHGFSTLQDVRVPIWSTKSFTARWAGVYHTGPLIEADLRAVAGDRAAGSVRNLLDITLRDAQLFYGRNIYNLGTIRPRGIARVNPTRTEASSRYLSRVVQLATRAQTLTNDQPQDAPNPAQIRADLLRVALFHDAMGVRGDAYPSLPLRWLDLSSQVVELRRPMLVAEIDAPASTLSLSPTLSSNTPAQSTILRVILDLSPNPSP